MNFLKVCSHHCGQLVNFSSLAENCDITHNTAKAWLSILEASYIIFLLRPYYRNFNKRIKKSPKLYFYDTGLLSYLLGLRTSKDFLTHPLKGALFENWVVLEFIKKKLNHNLFYDFYFWQDKTGHEVDLLIENGMHLFPIEIKSGMTITPDYFKNARYWRKINAESKQFFLIYAGTQKQMRDNVNVLSWKDLDELELNVPTEIV